MDAERVQPRVVQSLTGLRHREDETDREIARRRTIDTALNVATVICVLGPIVTIPAGLLFQELFAPGRRGALAHQAVPVAVAVVLQLVVNLTTAGISLRQSRHLRDLGLDRERDVALTALTASVAALLIHTVLLSWALAVKLG